MKKITLFVVLTIGIATQLVSQTFHSDTLSINNIKALIRAGGIQFWEPDSNNQNNRPVYEYPNGSGKKTIFSSSIWIGGLDNSNNLKLAAERYNQGGTDFWAGPITTNGTAVTNQNIVNSWNNVWTIKKQNLINYLSSSSYPNNPPTFVLNWPAHGDTNLFLSYQIAPFIDLNGNGHYEPFLGDYPKIYGDQCAFFVINDSKTHNETNGSPIGAEIHVFAYAFNNPNDSALHNTIFYKYKIINRSTTTLHDCYLGLFTDIDIGFAFDDYVACDVERSTYYGYNGYFNDTYYGTNIPAQGVSILGGPIMDADGIDNPKFDFNGHPICDNSVNGLNFGDGIVDNERLGMTKFIYYNNSSAPTGEPYLPYSHYKLLTGSWTNNTPLTWGGTGYDTTSTLTANFMFPGTSDTLNWGTGCGNRPIPNDWSEDSLHNAPADRRGLASMGKFTFQAGSTKYLDICYTTATSYNFKTTSVDILKERIDHIKYLFSNSPEIFQGYVGINDKKQNDTPFRIYPNPADKELNIEALTIKNCKYEIYNLIGQVIKSGNLNNDFIQKINISQIQKGVYFIKIFNSEITKTQKFIKK